MRCPAPAGGLNARECTCGTAASAPITATAGAAIPTRLATLCPCGGAVCLAVFRSVSLTFFFLLNVIVDLTNLPYAGSSPSYSATCAARRA